MAEAKEGLKEKPIEHETKAVRKKSQKKRRETPIGIRSWGGGWVSVAFGWKSDARCLKSRPSIRVLVGKNKEVLSQPREARGLVLSPEKKKSNNAAGRR